MTQLKCLLCGKAAKYAGVRKGEHLTCPHCQCTFPAPAPPPKKSRAKKTSKAEQQKQAAEEKAHLKKQELLVFYGKFVGFGFLALIVAGLVFQIVASAGARFSRSSQTSALEIDLKNQYKVMLRKRGDKSNRIVQVKELVVQWEQAENDEVPFTAEMVGFIDNQRIEIRGFLETSTGKWSAKYGGFPVAGQISVWKSLPVLMAFVLAAIALGGVFHIWRSRLMQ